MYIYKKKLVSAISRPGKLLVFVFAQRKMDKFVVGLQTLKSSVILRHLKRINMGCLSLLVLGLVAVTSVACLPAPNATRDLRLVHVIMRHGVRTPVDTYPLDPYINEKFEPNGWGQLTINGIKRLHNFGSELRSRYGKFLGEQYKAKEYYCEATGVDRSIASIMTVNSGLWPPSKAQRWSDDVKWFPIPVQSVPLNEDMLLLVRKDCPQYNIELDRIQNSPEFQTKLNSFESLFKNLSEHTGKDIKNYIDVEDVYTTLLAEREYGLKLPEWTVGYFPEKMLEPASLSFVQRAYNDKLARLKGGVLLRKLIGDWNAKVAATLDRKAFLYGGHDTTISNLLSALKIFDPQVPNYGMAIMLELLFDEDKQEFGVEIFVKNSTENAYHMQIPGCEKFCPLTDLIKLTTNVVPGNWEQECATDDPNYTTAKPHGP